jgi:23S rRNA (adenine2030-N6)-methyltransferase
MNYRHGYHAGNFADVFKHAVLARVLTLMSAKDAPFRVIDTHAGAGRYDLDGEHTTKTGEAESGIRKLLGNLPRGAALDLLQPYLRAVEQHAPAYPGSPLIVQTLLRAQDAAVFCELHPQEFAALEKAIGRDRLVKALALDGWTALKSLLPPKERRGVILIDPPYEDPAEFKHVADGIEEATRRFATGVYLVWYPVKNRHDTDAALRRIGRAAGKPTLKLKLELEIEKPQTGGPLTATGLLVINPPWKLKEECELLLPALRQSLAGPNRGAVLIEPID